MSHNKAVSDFVDEVQLNVRGGDGGAGCVSFRREAHVAKGGPDGGDGGRGGDVILLADHNVVSLLAFRDHPHRRAASGTHGSGKQRHGAGGDDLVVSVPVGTIVKDRDGVLLADLATNGASYVATAGGQGGRGNASFLSNSRRAPGFAEQGEYGEEHWVLLELELLADAALIGFPNAGKSTLIAAVSAAKPKIANYPFTTLVPNLGVVRFHEHEMVIADIPGLVEGAAEGRGLGHQFLRHVRRARALVLLIDLAADDETSPADQERILLDELGRFRPELLDRPRLVIGSRSDIAHSEFSDAFDGLQVSGVTHEGLDIFLGQLSELVEQARRSEPASTEVVLHRPVREGFTVTRDDEGSWRVVGRRAERAVAINNLGDPDAMVFVQNRLKKMGVEKALAKAGVQDGDLVRLGNLEMVYSKDMLA